MKTFTEIVRYRIKMLRVAQDLTLADLAKRCGMSHAVIGKVETGDRALDLETTEVVSTALGVTPSALLEAEQFRSALSVITEDMSILEQPTPKRELAEPDEPGWWWCCRPEEEPLCVYVEDGAEGWSIFKCGPGSQVAGVIGQVFTQMVWVKANNPWGKNF